MRKSSVPYEDTFFISYFRKLFSPGGITLHCYRPPNVLLLTTLSAMEKQNRAIWAIFRTFAGLI